jgi:hypothetical protein
LASLNFKKPWRCCGYPESYRAVAPESQDITDPVFTTWEDLTLTLPKNDNTDHSYQVTHEAFPESTTNASREKPIRITKVTANVVNHGFSIKAAINPRVEAGF